MSRLRLTKFFPMLNSDAATSWQWWVPSGNGQLWQWTPLPLPWLGQLAGLVRQADMNSSATSGKHLWPPLHYYTVSPHHLTIGYQVLSAARIFREHDLLHNQVDHSTVPCNKLICEYLHLHTPVSSLSYSQIHVVTEESAAQWIPLMDIMHVSQWGMRWPWGLFPHKPTSCIGNMELCCWFRHPTSLLDLRRHWWTHYIGQTSLGNCPAVLSSHIPWIQ